jgi:hypothetical protein
MHVVRKSAVASVQFGTQVYDRHKDVVRETVTDETKTRPPPVPKL